MKTDDINRFKGQLKTAIQQWGDKKIDEIMPGKPQIRTFLKNGFNNFLVRQDEKLNKYIDGLVLFAGNEQGVIDTDAMVDMAADMFRELESHRYQFEMFDIEFGKGQVALHLPQNFMFDLLLGGSGTFRMTVDDILEFKNYFS